ncbi:phytoene desaturase family protein [Polyangium spumosum]|uniref:Pyridine nucleotide-disulfide oxidoreductase domain-containing protein 2 n=1 Tax=Polyangium spumosum TaxID=889282 RepID=A0A6N7PUI5_9BACT|nr:NAD(P)/FAD-dependent oxidoreductase [Polyangium spumosum]MRG93915.1 FAD-dependent oxidoreductase [Polyangium spumosum]
MTRSHDAIFIGGGHNALIAAAYLARAGWSVLVLEKNDRPGGFVRTEELTLPGFVHDTYATAHPLFVTGPAYAELRDELEARGLHYLNCDIPAGVSMPGGRSSVLFRDPAASVAELDRLAPGDGAAFMKLIEGFSAHAGSIFPLFSMNLASPEANAFIRKLMLGEGGLGLSSFAADFMMSARDLLETRFRSEVFRGLISPWLLHAGRGPEEPNSAFWLTLFLLSVLSGGVPTPAGGSEMLVKALVRLIEDHGGEIRSHCAVERILVEGGEARGVVTADGERYHARRAVIASTNPDQLYLKLLAGTGVVHPEIERQAKGFRYGRGAVQVHLALSAPPDFPDERLRRGGLVHLTTGLDGLSRAINEAARGLLPAEPTISFDVPSALDPARVPPGKAVARLQMLEVPRRARGDAAGLIDVGDGVWNDDLKNRFADRVLEIAAKHVPNLKSSILARRVIGPADLARFNPNAGDGDPYGGAHDLAQSYFLRPIAGQPSHRTQVPNLYMIGAATWPGHGVGGGSGYIVAKQLLA